MPTILIKGVSEELLKDLKRLKVELGCKTWAELLAKFVASNKVVPLEQERLKDMKEGAKAFLKLSDAVSARWTGAPTVLEEFRRSRHHDKQ